MANKSKNKLSTAQTEALIKTLKTRFEKNKTRHKNIDWSVVEVRLKKSPEKCVSLLQMENTGGEPDVVGLDKKSGEIIFYDCAAETPAERRSLCYDEEALEARKENKPAGSAMGMAEEMGVEILNEEQYLELQALGKFDLKTSSWLNTPAPIRKLGGSIFGDRRYDYVFIYHNGAQSYYAGRGFRAMIRV